ncbi:MAG TPA: hypothetical protein VGO51_09685 [Burkholderiaceae bacterium]|jgi:hypothetical protein|nr:hypothetical protein [Burkholderiaceae bacterium]
MHAIDRPPIFVRYIDCMIDRGANLELFGALHAGFWIYDAVQCIIDSDAGFLTERLALINPESAVHGDLLS